MGEPTLLHHLLLRAAQRWPDKVCLVDDGQVHTHAELWRKAECCALHLLKNGVQVGDRVALLAENSAEFIAGYFAPSLLGAIVVPLNTQAGVSSWNEALIDVRARCLLVDSKHARAAQELPWVRDGSCALIALEELECPTACRAHPDGAVGVASVPSKHQGDDGVVDDSSRRHSTGADAASFMADADDAAVIIYTSGTAAKPRGAMLTHRNILSNTESIVAAVDVRSSDRMLVVLPFFYVYGASLLHTHLWVGGTLVLEKRFMFPQLAVQRMADQQCTAVAGVPSTFALLLNRTDLAEHPPPTLRYVTQAGGPMAPAQVERLQQALPNRRIYLMYGATEATARLTVLQPEDWSRARGSVGKPLAGIDMEVRRGDGTVAPAGDLGEIHAKGRSIMQGYWNDAQTTAQVLQGGWLRTGDLGYRDDAGYFYITGRAKDIIKAGAHRVAARELEDCLLQHPSVHEVAVIGKPDAVLGERISAYIVLRDAECVLAPSELLAFARERLAPFKVPQEVHICDALPKNAAGKIDKRQLG